MNRIKIKFFLLVYILFMGCSGSDDPTQESQAEEFYKNLETYVKPNILNGNKIYEYYEIKNNNQIIHTNIGMDYINVLQYFKVDDYSYTSSQYRIEKNYNIKNDTLGIDTTADVMIFYSYDTLTKASKEFTYIKNYGLYEAKKSYCTINSDENNCTSYLYIKY